MPDATSEPDINASCTIALLTQKVIEGSFPYSDIEKGFTYIPAMYVEPFSISLYGKEPLRTFYVNLLSPHDASKYHFAP